MSKFTDIINQHHQKVETAQSEKARIEAQEKSELEFFLKSFEAATNAVIRPALNDFAEDLKQTGYHPILKEEVDGYSNPVVQVSFVPQKGEILNPRKANESSAFVVRGLIKTKNIEITAYADQRVINKKHPQVELTVKETTRELIDTKLAEFLVAALNRD